jgi:acyl carrier protein
MDRNEVTAKLREFIVKDLLRNPGYELADDEALITGGMMDSFSLAQVGVFAEKAFNVYIPDTDLTVSNMDTLAQMVDRIMKG